MSKKQSTFINSFVFLLERENYGHAISRILFLMPHLLVDEDVIWAYNDDVKISVF